MHTICQCIQFLVDANSYRGIWIESPGDIVLNCRLVSTTKIQCVVSFDNTYHYQYYTIKGAKITYDGDSTGSIYGFLIGSKIEWPGHGTWYRPGELSDSN